MRTTILIFCLLAVLSCGREPTTFEGNDDHFNDGGQSDSDSDSDSDSSLPDTETDTDTDTDTDTSSSTDTDSGTNGNDDTDTDTDTETETSSETASETDSETVTDTTTNDDTESDIDTSTDGITCPWNCHELTETGYDTCDSDTESPSIVQNFNFECTDDHDVCCQPLDSDLPGALHDYCNDQGLECRIPVQCEGKVLHTEYYCKNATLVCCDSGGAKESKSEHRF